jgi:wobble nucleotide-excising tRNase
MITKLKKIKNLSVFQNFIWPNELQSFSRKNVVYGWNYTGKTSLSRIFAMLGNKSVPEKYKGIEFEIEYDNEGNKSLSSKDVSTFPLEVYVFNSDYVSSNFKWDTISTLSGIAFDVGQNATLRTKVDDLDKVTKWITTKKIEKLNLDVKEFESLNVLFTNEARKIKNDIFNSVIEFNRGHLTTIKSQIEGSLETHILADETELKKTKADALAVNNKLKIHPVLLNLKSKALYDEVKKLLLETPPQSEVIDILESKSELYQWAQEGLTLHKNNLNECSFCGSTILSDRIQKLTNYFSNAASQLRNKIEELRDQIINEESDIEKIILPKSKNDFIDSIHSKYEPAIKAVEETQKGYVTYLNKLISFLEMKEDGKIFISIAADDYNETPIENLKEAIAALNLLINEHNEFIQNFDSTQDQARDRLKKHYVATILKEHNVKDIESKKNKAEQWITKYNAIKSKIVTKKEGLLAQIKSIVAGKDEMNRYIQLFFGRNDILIEVTNDDKFVLKRGLHHAENLSEGEKTAISFAYFLVFLEGVVKDKKSVDAIVFIDDPISSLDSNHIAQVFAIINSFFFRRGLNLNDLNEVLPCFKQLIISTHNFDFFNFLKDATYLNKTKKGHPSFSCSYFYVQRLNDKESKLIELPKVLRKKSEYIHLFEILNKYYENKCDANDETLILIPNALRRFFELYTLIKLPDSDSEIDQRINTLMGGTHNLKVLHHFSHASSFEKLTKHDELMAIVPQAVKELFELLAKDQMHYESLKRAIS